jgi:magnesium and cobalt transporter
MTDDKPPSTGGRRSGLLARWAEAFRSAPRDRQALAEILEQSRRSRILDADEYRMLEGVLEVSTIQVRDIMIPRGKMVVLERDASPQEMLQIIIDSGHSRFPVIADDRDEVIGILLAKDLLRYLRGERPGPLPHQGMPAPGGVHPGEQAPQRPVEGVPRQPQPHGDRGRRVRRASPAC